MARLSLLIAAAAAATAAASRMASRAETQDFKICRIDGPDGIFVSFPVDHKKCITQCVRPAVWEGEAVHQEEKQFADSFEPQLSPKTGMCVCSVNGEQRVQFEPLVPSKEDCRIGSIAAKRQCWTTYKRMREITYIQEGKLLVPRRLAHKYDADASYSLDRTCKETCTDDDDTGKNCRRVSLPSVLETLSEAVKHNLKVAIDESRALKSKNPGLLEEIDVALAPDDQITLQFAKLDENANDLLSLEELVVGYPEVGETKLQHYINKLGADDAIDLETFRKLLVMLAYKWEIQKTGDRQFELVCVNRETNEKEEGKCLEEPDMNQVNECLD